MRKLEAAARVAGRHAVKAASKSRVASGLFRGAEALFRSLGQVLHQLWLEVTGFVFLAFAVIVGFAAARAWGAYQAGETGSGRTLLAVCLSAMFGWFGVSSFWRARERRKS